LFVVIGSSSIVCDLCDHHVVIFLRFVLSFVPTLLCRGVGELAFCTPCCKLYFLGGGPFLEDP